MARGGADGKATTTIMDSHDSTMLFQRIEKDPIVSFPADSFLEQFQKYGFAWFRHPATCTDAATSSETKGLIKSSLPKSRTILDFVHRHHPNVCMKNWSVENRGDCPTESELCPQSLMKHKDKSFYISTIIQRSTNGRIITTSNKNGGKDDHNKNNKDDDDDDDDDRAFAELDSLVPATEILEDLHLTSGAWLFIGHCAMSEKDEDKSNNDKSKNNKKRKRNMVGRAEHVDDVTHSGTFHVQISGEKTWFIRPHPELYLGEELPDLSTLPNAEQDELTKSWRIKVHVQEGDVLVLNTKVWYHYTELPQSHTLQQPWSISIARDFFLPLPCPEDVAEDDIILVEEDLPDEIPRTDNPNCALAEVDVFDDENEEDGGGGGDGGVDNGEGGEGGEKTRIVLVALRDLKEGDLLSVAIEETEEKLCNADETIDPRLIADTDWNAGEAVLNGNDLPNEIPRSRQPNCELTEEADGKIMLRAIENIEAGDIFCILPDKEQEYEEVELDRSSGRLLRDG